jgi:hypothetical protein
MFDNIHPSTLGHKAIFEQIQLDVPFLFKDIADFHIDFVNETTVEKIPDSIQYSSHFKFKEILEGTLEKVSVHPGGYLFFRKKYSSDPNNIINALQIPSRPLPPLIFFDNFKNSVDWKYTPSYTSYSEYEFSIDNGVNWETCNKKPILIGEFATSPEQIQIRVKSSPKNFKSEISNSITFKNFITAVSESKDASEICIYPNPSSDQIRIKNLTEKAKAQLYTLDGIEIESFNLTPTHCIISIINLKNGLYHLKLTSDEGNFEVFKILKN